MPNRRFTCARLSHSYLTRSMPRLLTMTFTTAVFSRSSSWRFEAFPCRTAPKGPPSSLVQHDAFRVFLTQYFGNAIGRGPYYLVEQTKHFTNLFDVLVGQSSKSRKGTSAERIRAILNIAEPDWARERIVGGMSSGEGLIYAVRDEVYGMKNGKQELIDEGIDDKRLLLDEREFFQALTVLKREGNTLSRVVRDAWDCREHIGSLTKRDRTKATKPHISITGHITVEELRQSLDHTSMANGYANRYLFVLVHRSKLLPHGSPQDAAITGLLGEKTREAITAARSIGRVTMTEAAAKRRTDIYTALSEGAPGLLGAITNRAEAQTIRLALIYALLDGAAQIDVVHLNAALAVWRFCEAYSGTARRGIPKKPMRGRPTEMWFAV